MTDEELGREYKKKHPGKYNQFSDEYVGRKVRAKNPGTALSPTSPPMMEFTEQLDHFVEQLDKLALQYNIDRGMLGTFFQRKRREGQAKLIQVVVEQMRLMIEAMTLRTEAHSAHQRHQFALELESLIHQNATVIYQLATSQGIDVGTYQQKLMMQLEVSKEVLIEKGKSQIRLDEERQRAQIEAKKAYDLKLAEADVTAKMILLDKILDAHKNYHALLANKAPRKQIEAAKQELDELERNRDNWGTIMKRKKKRNKDD